MKHRYFVDHNLSHRIAKAISGLYEADVVALIDRFDADAPDEEWLAKLDGRVVVTEDLEIRKKDVYRRLLSAKAATVVFLGKGWQKLQLNIKAAKLVQHWPEMDEKIHSGCSYELSVSGRLNQLK